MKRVAQAEVKKLKGQLKDMKAREQRGRGRGAASTSGRGRGRGRGRGKGRGRGQPRGEPAKSDEMVALEAQLAAAESRGIKGTLNDETITYLQVGYDVIMWSRLF